MACTVNKQLITTSVVGGLVAILGITFVFVWPMLFDNIMFEQLALTPNSLSYSLWKEVPIPIYLSFYMFNWTNYEKARKEKPNLVEMGPYVFSEHRTKTNLTWNDNNQTITYYQNRTWIFEPSMSNGSLDDLVTNLNVPAIAATYAARDISPILKFGLNLLMDLRWKTKYYVTKSVRELIFDGYDDPILRFAESLPPSIIHTKLPFDKFGWFYTRNGSYLYDGLFNMQTGVEDITKLGVLSRWNNSDHTEFYPSHCGQINGSAGEIFPPNLDKTHTLELYSTDVCRTLSLSFKEEMSFKGISGYRYNADDRMFVNASTDPDNWCFCGGDGKVCYPNGILNLMKCKWNAPIFMSMPHFYHADPSYRSAVIGMSPGPQHQTYADVEPLAGLPMQVDAALQINVLLQPMKEFTILKDMPTIFFPAFWFRQTATINEGMTVKIKSFLYLSQMGSVLSFVFLGIGVSTMLVAAVIYVSRRAREDDSLYLVNGNSPLQTET